MQRHAACEIPVCSVEKAGCFSMVCFKTANQAFFFCFSVFTFFVLSSDPIVVHRLLWRDSDLCERLSDAAAVPPSSRACVCPLPSVARHGGNVTFFSGMISE